VIEALYDWMKNIIVFMIISTVILNLLGKSNYKKYVGLITGLILVLLVIGPVLSLTGKISYFDFSMDSYGSLVEAQDLSKEMFEMEKQSTIDIFEEYKQVIVNQTENLIAEKGLTVVSMEIDVITDKSSTDFGKILQINLVAAYKTNQEMPGKTGDILSIEKIEIGQISFDSDTEKNQESQQNSLSAMENSIKILLADFYNMDSNNININIQEDHDGKR
jgi:stage III sporulation protein AF